MLRLVLFDLDNTLVDRQTVFRRWAELFASEHRLGGDAVTWLCAADADGSSDRSDLFEGARREFGLAETLDELVSRYREQYFDHFDPDPATNASLGRLRDAGWRIGIITNGPSTQRRKMDRAGLTSLVDAWCISDDLGIQKPDRRIFEEVMRRCSDDGDGQAAPAAAPAGEPERWMAEHSSTWMVGDDPRADIEGGRRSGLRTAWIHRGRTWTEPGFRPELTAGHVTEVVEQILRASGS